MEAIVLDTAARFTYGAVKGPDRWYTGHDAIPAVACAVGDCIDINTYLVAALRTAGYDTAYLTCYFFDDDPNGIAAGMHCWVRTRHEGLIEDWDIAHFKKAGRADVHAALNPVPGLRVTLAHGRDHVYRWNGLDIHLPIPSRPELGVGGWQHDLGCAAHRHAVPRLSKRPSGDTGARSPAG